MEANQGIEKIDSTRLAFSTGATSPVRYSRTISSGMKKVSFTGVPSDKFITSIGKAGSNPLFPLIVSSIGAILFRVPIVAGDSKTPKEERNYAAAWLGAMSAIGLGIQLSLKKPIENLSENLSRKLLNIKNPTLPKQISAVAGGSNVVQFLSWVLVLNAANIVVTRYLKRGMDFLTEKFKGKDAVKKDEKPQTPEEKQKQKKIDIAIIGSLAAIGAFVGLNIIGKRFGKGPIATDAIKDIGKKLNQTLHISEKFSKLWLDTKNSISRLAQKDGFTGKTFNKIDKGIHWIRSEKGLDCFARQANADDKWLDRNIIANMIIRPLILLPTGQYFAVFSSIINEALALLSIKTAGKFLVNKVTPSTIVKAVGVGKEEAAKFAKGAITELTKGEAATLKANGIRIIVDQGIKNIGLICIGMGFLNNVISRNMLKIIKHPEKENETGKPGEKTVNLATINTPKAVPPAEIPKDMDSWIKLVNKRQNISDQILNAKYKA